MKSYISILSCKSFAIMYISVLMLVMNDFSAIDASTRFADSFEVIWGKDNVRLPNNDEVAQLRLDNTSGSGFQSKTKYLFGSFSMSIKLVPGNSAGTVIAFYMSSGSSSQDELDFEFLGNLAEHSYDLQSNVFTSGAGHREQRFRLWFDPTVNYHNYPILWNQNLIVFFVDSTPIRVLRNNEGMNVPYLKNKAMNVISSIWNGEGWATGGKVKIDWSKDPFVASFREFSTDGCEAHGSDAPSCGGKWWDLPEIVKM